MSFTAEDLARTALLRILPRSRYRLAAQSDSRFQTFAPHTARIAYRQQGATPAFLLFSGPGQDARAAALAAAQWAEGSWRPNAIQRVVHPGVVVVQVAPGLQLAEAGLVAGAAVPAAVWTVDSDSGRVEIAGSPPGSPAAGELRRAAASLVQGHPAPSLGELDLAERAVMQVRTIAMPRLLSSVLGIALLLFVLRFGLAGVFSLFALPGLLTGGTATAPANLPVVVAALVLNVVMLVGIALGVGLYFNFRNLAFRLPGFSSPVPRNRNITWAGYAAVMVVLAITIDGVIPAAERATAAGAGAGAHVSATVSDDGKEVLVRVGGDLTVDLSGWPTAEWPGVEFKTTDASILTLDSAPLPAARPIAVFGAQQPGVAGVEAASADGRLSYQLRVGVASG